MKIGIITFHFVNNYGGVLQAYALYKTMSNYGEVEIVDYRNNFICMTDLIRVLPITSNIQEIRSGISTISDRRNRLKKFKEFVDQNMILSSCRYYSDVDLMRKPQDYDLVICGSDQIWNPYLTLGIKKAYFCQWAKNTRIIAYAPSFGTSKLLPIHRNTIKKYLKNIDKISVREKEGKYLIDGMGYKSEVMVDPCLLLSKEKWMELLPEQNKNVPKYILVYMMQNDKKIYESIGRIKQKTGYKVIEISRYGFKSSNVDELAIDVGPIEFLDYINNAEIVITNSYHGFIFSMLFEKKLFFKQSKRFRMRLRNLYKILDLEVKFNEHEFNYIDFSKKCVKEKIENEKQRAINYLGDL